MFLLPIFSETLQEFEGWLQGQVQKSLAEIEETSGTPASETMKDRFLETEKEKYGVRWPFNRAVGWVHITRSVGGFTFTVAVASNKKRREPKRSYIPLTLLEQPNQGKHISFSSCSNTSEIIQRFDEVLKSIISSNSCFKGCYVDASSIKDNAEFVDWKAVLE